jgi:acetoin:2,6-dichlorophenolindophenol oxidoreductase subunit alpha
MLRIRRFEEAATRLVNAGRIPDIHTSTGQEAAIVGACLALGDRDAITGTHRSHGHPIGKGAELKLLMAELWGKETGICKGRGGSMHLADNSVGIISESAIVGGGIPIATGSGLSAKVRGTDQVTLCFFGDGAVNQGAFHEALNMGSLWKLPVIYFCENNGYAITTSIEKSHAQPDVASRAVAYGMPGVTVDGQDVTAVHEVVSEAVARARGGDGPTLIDAKTYRFDEHCMPLYIPGPPYRSTDEIDHFMKNRDPITLFQTTLVTNGWTAEELQQVDDDVKEEVVAAVEYAEQSPFPAVATLHDYMYATAVVQ